MLACRDIEPAVGVPLHVVASGHALRRIDFGVHEGGACEPSADHPILDEAVRQLRAYFAGELRDFDVPVELGGTTFQNRVWRALRRIPYGETRSYL
ncbi:MAG: methylated-DNA--[protein]-cysteine S-methyltransferase, partial [Bryobacteraceae bacterium]